MPHAVKPANAYANVFTPNPKERTGEGINTGICIVQGNPKSGVVSNNHVAIYAVAMRPEKPDQKGLANVSLEWKGMDSGGKGAFLATIGAVSGDPVESATAVSTPVLLFEGNRVCHEEGKNPSLRTSGVRMRLEPYEKDQKIGQAKAQEFSVSTLETKDLGGNVFRVQLSNALPQAGYAPQGIVFQSAVCR